VALKLGYLELDQVLGRPGRALELNPSCLDRCRGAPPALRSVLDLVTENAAWCATHFREKGIKSRAKKVR